MEDSIRARLSPRLFSAAVRTTGRTIVSAAVYRVGWTRSKAGQRAEMPAPQSATRAELERVGDPTIAPPSLLSSALIPRISSTQSENQLQRELDLARAAEVAADGPRRRDLPEGGDREVVLRLGEIRVIEQVERLAAELQRDPLGDLRVFRDRQVDVLEAGAGQDVPARIAEP